MPVIPTLFTDWFQRRDWQIYPHQLQIISAWQAGQSVLLVAPTGAGKTLCGFLPSLIAFQQNPVDTVHTIYISPLKALAVDIARNLTDPVAEMGLISGLKHAQATPAKQTRPPETHPAPVFANHT